MIHNGSKPIATLAIAALIFCFVMDGPPSSIDSWPVLGLVIFLLTFGACRYLAQRFFLLCPQCRGQVSECRQYIKDDPPTYYIRFSCKSCGVDWDTGEVEQETKGGVDP